MRKALVIGLGLFLLTGFFRPVFGVEKVEILEMIGIVEEAPRLDSGQATDSAEATNAGQLKIEEVVKEDITERTSLVKGKLEGYLAEKKAENLKWYNFIQVGIRQAIIQGVSANTIVLVLLFPLVALMIASARHLLGLTGFGIFVPAMLSVAFVATGIRVGLVLFAVIWVLATISRKITKKLKMQYLPRMALLMWFISIGVLAVLLGAVNVKLGELSAVSIFPILILMLLSENFIEVQVGKSKREAFRVTMQTIVMAIGSAVVLKLDWVQKLVLLNPEIYLILVAVMNIYVGKYVGLRLLENFKFKSLLKK
ncbi:MAG: 7TM domain-containing protein [Patescibacteria group bacterium]|nr:7TM domain-containing protein [Patescibacteria group bacterium]